ncbi:hypothetical protein V6N00_10930 [Tersicoccus sp. MR15.9]|uniref:hypothetical protein n=1 Tax=Tersicoccus mangrovi TaxID=3121635 RepID=UPI002FE6C3FD
MHLGRQLHALIPDGFDVITYTTSKTLSFYRETLVATSEDGRRESLLVDDEVTVLSSELRDVMYRQGPGTWFGAVVTVTSRGKLDAQYNYDDEPYWDFPVDPKTYVTDLETYPRDDAHMPEWLQQKVRDHEAGKTE